MASSLLLVGLLLATCSLALASDPSPLQDFCVADLNSKAILLPIQYYEGVVCKDPKDVKAEDFLFRGLQRMGNTSNAVGSNVTAVTVNQLAGLNTFGISMARIDFAPWGLNAPHTHPRATEILTVIEGRLLVGFVTSNPENRLITKVLQKGDVFVFPQGLIHFQQNVGKGYALAIAVLDFRFIANDLPPSAVMCFLFVNRLPRCIAAIDYVSGIHVASSDYWLASFFARLFKMTNFAVKHSIMTQEMVENFCNDYYIPDEVHPVAPGRDKTIT
ncbi:putative germin-like protein 2-1 [Tanacetum coccineum]